MPLRPKHVEVVHKPTNRKMEIPEHWMDDEILGAPFRLSARAQREKDAAVATDVQTATDDVETSVSSDPNASPDTGELPADAAGARATSPTSKTPKE